MNADLRTKRFIKDTKLTSESVLFHFRDFQIEKHLRQNFACGEGGYLTY